MYHWTLEIYDKEQNPKTKHSIFALANLEKRRELGWSAIGVSASGGFVKIVEMLLSNELLHKIAWYEALWLASELGKDEAVQVFLIHCIDLNFKVRFVQGMPLNDSDFGGQHHEWRIPARTPVAMVTSLIHHNPDISQIH